MGAGSEPSEATQDGSNTPKENKDMGLESVFDVAGHGIPVTGDALAGSDRGTAADAAGPATDATTPSGDATIADTDARSVGDALPPGPDGPRDDARISACATLTSAAAPATRPTDIVWLIDGSPSMRQEIDTVTANLNDFAAAIGAAGRASAGCGAAPPPDSGRKASRRKSTIEKPAWASGASGRSRAP